MKIDVLVAEIGSTTTLVNAFHNIGTDNLSSSARGAPTTVLDGDVRIGLKGAIEDLCKNKGVSSIEYEEMLATSSAAGGLKMTVHGLVYDMTVKAAQKPPWAQGQHPPGNGGPPAPDGPQIKEIHPNLIMIAGGVDYGERTRLLQRGMIRSWIFPFPSYMQEMWRTRMKCVSSSKTPKRLSISLKTSIPKLTSSMWNRPEKSFRMPSRITSSGSRNGTHTGYGGRANHSTRAR